MAALDFPNSPTTGQIFSGPNSKWKWDGTKWLDSGGVPGAAVPNITEYYR
jgi:hypothetical protein